MSAFYPGTGEHYAYEMASRLQQTMNNVLTNALPKSPTFRMQRAMGQAVAAAMPESAAFRAQRAMSSVAAGALPEKPTAQAQRTVGQMLARQVNQRTALSASLAVNRLAAIQRPAIAIASARLPGIVSSSFSPMVRVQARVARDALLGNQWQQTMLSLYPALRARKTLENISRLTRGFGSGYYPPHPGFDSYRRWPIPEDSDPSDTATETEIMGELPDVADPEIAVRDALREIRRWARENPVEVQIIVAVVGVSANVLIAIYL